MAMVSAGRILILPKGAWNNATTYQMLDMVTGSNNTAYLAKQASVNVDPVSDTSQTYWQPFGSSLAADGITIVDNNGTISVPIDGASIYIDLNDGEIKAALSTLADVDITNIGNGKVLAWNTTSQKWEAVAISSSFSGLTDVNFTNLQNGQVAKYNSTSQKWENASDAGGLVPHLIIISETGSTVTATKGATVITATETSTGHFECDVPEFGTYTIDAVLGGDDAQVSLVVDAVKIYTVDDSHFHADITVTYPTGAQVSCSKSGETTMYATGSPYTFTVHSSGTWTITGVKDGVTVTEDVVISTSGQTESVDLTNKTVTVTLYSAAADTVSFTDASGSKTATTDSTGKAENVSIVIPTFASSNITFTSSVAKDPSNLSNDYSKTINITDATTEVKVMPEESAYWYGYEGSGFSAKLSVEQGYSGNNITRNTNNIYALTGNSYAKLASGTVDVTNYSSLKILYSGGSYNNENGSTRYLGLTTTNEPNETFTHYKDISGDTALKLESYDISSYTGNTMYGVSLTNIHSGNNHYCTMTVAAMWIE